MAWIEAKTSNHCKLLILLHADVFSEYTDYCTMGMCHFKIISISCDLSLPCFYWYIFQCIFLLLFTTYILNNYTHPTVVMVLFFFMVFLVQKVAKKKKKKLDTDNDRNISGCKDAPDSLALPPSQWFQTIWSLPYSTIFWTIYINIHHLLTMGTPGTRNSSILYEKQ